MILVDENGVIRNKMRLCQTPLHTEIRARMALMQFNRQIHNEFAMTLYEHSTFNFCFGRDPETLKGATNLREDDTEVDAWKGAAVDMLNTALTKTMALSMQKCHIVFNLDPDDEDQFGMVWQILNAFVHRLWSLKEAGPRLEKLTIECKVLTSELRDRYNFAFEPLVHLKDLQPGLQRIVFDGFDEISLKLMQRFVGAMEKSEAPPLILQDHGKKSDELELTKRVRKFLGRQCDTVYDWGFFGPMSTPKVIEIMTTDEDREAGSEECVCVDNTK